MAQSLEKKLAALKKKQAAARRANEREIKRIQAHQNRTRQIGTKRV